MAGQNRMNLTTARDPAPPTAGADDLTQAQLHDGGRRLAVRAAARDAGLLPPPSAGPAATNTGWFPQ